MPRLPPAKRRVLSCALHHRYHHRAPVTAKTRLVDDELLACVMGGVDTDVEQTMIEIQRRTVVQQTRVAFQYAMRVCWRSNAFQDAA